MGTPAQPAAARVTSPERSAAQKAFFQAALARAGAPASASRTTAAPASAPRAPLARITPDTPIEPPSRSLRPGSLLDIKV